MDLAEHLRARGIGAVAINELRDEMWPGVRRVTDDQVSAEVARVPSILVTLNVRDYADRAFIERLVRDHSISVVIVRVPKSEAQAVKRAQAIRDIAHRHAHRIARLASAEPTVVSANRVGFRRRPLAGIADQ